MDSPTSHRRNEENTVQKEHRAVPERDFSLEAERELSKGFNNIFERMPFRNVLLMHAIHGTMTKELYSKISKLNEHRNDIIHGLVHIDQSDEKKKLIRITHQGILVCEEIFAQYREPRSKGTTVRALIASQSLKDDR